MSAHNGAEQPNELGEGEEMQDFEDFNDYGDQELIEEINIAAWAAVMHDGVLRAKAWARFSSASQTLQSRYPEADVSLPVSN